MFGREVQGPTGAKKSPGPCVGKCCTPGCWAQLAGCRDAGNGAASQVFRWNLLCRWLPKSCQVAPLPG